MNPYTPPAAPPAVEQDPIRAARRRGFRDGLGCGCLPTVLFIAVVIIWAFVSQPMHARHGTPRTAASSSASSFAPDR